jgi:hypothetical protein
MMVNMRDWVVLFQDESMGTLVLQEMEELAEMRSMASMRGLTAICMSVVFHWPREPLEAKGPPKQRAR